MISIQSAQELIQPLPLLIQLAEIGESFQGLTATSLHGNLNSDICDAVDKADAHGLGRCASLRVDGHEHTRRLAYDVRLVPHRLTRNAHQAPPMQITLADIKDAANAIDNLSKQLMELPQTWRIIVPTALASSFAKQASAPDTDMEYPTQVKAANLEQGDWRSQDTARVHAESSVQVTLPSKHVVRNNFLLGGVRNCALLNDQLPSHFSSALEDSSASSNEFLALAKGQMVRAWFFADPNDESNPLLSTVKCSWKWHNSRLFSLASTSEEQDRASGTRVRCLQDGISFLLDQTARGTGNLRAAFGLGICTQTSIGAPIDFYSGPPLDQSQLADLQLSPQTAPASPWIYFYKGHMKSEDQDSRQVGFPQKSVPSRVQGSS